MFLSHFIEFCSDSALFALFANNVKILCVKNATKHIQILHQVKGLFANKYVFNSGSLCLLRKSFIAHRTLVWFFPIMKIGSVAP